MLCPRIVDTGASNISIIVLYGAKTAFENTKEIHRLLRTILVLSLFVLGFSSTLLAIDPPPITSTPEINAAAATNAVALLGGASLLIRSRRKK